MEKWLKELIESVGQGNPGALTVIRELQWFSHWEKMLRYFEEIGLVGEKLWEKCSDEYNLSFHDFGHAMDREMSEYNAKKELPLTIKVPKFAGK